ncbi:MAG: YdcF family protein [Minwuia sp.]|nr:YdcF family protein [Minwuia sp.]
MSGKLLFRIIFVLLALWFGGLLRFTADVQLIQPSPTDAEAIVVLTGSAGRVTTGLQLLARDPTRKMLISGVGTRTDKQALASAHPDARALLDCCVALGPEAQDTVGNAREIARWANTEQVSSLIVVTAAYHMPRSLIELQRKTGTIRLEPWPTRAGKDDPSGWWREGPTFQRVVIEYHKYVFSLIRARVYDDIGDVSA